MIRPPRTSTMECMNPCTTTRLRLFLSSGASLSLSSPALASTMPEGSGSIPMETPTEFNLNEVGQMVYDISIRLANDEKKIQANRFAHESFERQQSALNKSVEDHMVRLLVAVKDLGKKPPDGTATVMTSKPRGWSLPRSVLVKPVGFNADTWPKMKIEPPRFSDFDVPFHRGTYTCSEARITDPSVVFTKRRHNIGPTVSSLPHDFIAGDHIHRSAAVAKAGPTGTDGNDVIWVQVPGDCKTSATPATEATGGGPTRLPHGSHLGRGTRGQPVACTGTAQRSILKNTFPRRGSMFCLGRTAMMRITTTLDTMSWMRTG
ncbi:hypothetical protein SASPL_126633 [Salvia splendens]|uniref:Uncharacterized protein n=1 Tax=Salvia splendens TaxID=180675 RepID=A0A8X8XI20_SALSN|nr:hypothetical protein SASPL_126633 [Salvia splendens]